MSDKILQPGTKVTYQNEDGKTAAGVIHGVRKREDGSGKVTSVSYLVDTGEDVHSQEVSYNPRIVAINNHLAKELAKKEYATDEERIEHMNELVPKIKARKDLPKSETITETIRQPVQVEVPASLVKAA